MTEIADPIPVTSSGVPIRNLWYMLTYAWNEARLRQQWRAEVESVPSLDALLATILTRLVEQRMRIGLGRNYKNHEALISGIRGRVQFGESLKRLAFEHGKAFCRFQDYTPNVLHNQIIRSTLARLTLTGRFGRDKYAAENLRRRIRTIVHALHTIDLIELKLDVVRREQLQRHDADYRVMLAICCLLCQRHMPTETEGADALPGLDRDAMILWRVLEAFVAKFYQWHLSDWSVRAQPTLQWPVTDVSELIPALKPDVVLRHKPSGMMAVVDTKFRSRALTAGRWDKLTFNRDHLFQMYAYLRSQEHLSDCHRAAAGVLLYPTVKNALSESTLL